jgi:hypothetical protein
MAQDTNVVGGVSGAKQEVDANLNAYVRTPGYDGAGVARGGGDTNSPASVNEIDNGAVFGTRTMLSAEVDDDYRTRVAHDNWLDEENFTDTAQNTGKFSHTFTTLTATESTAGLLTNSGNITTTTTGMTFGTFAMFPVSGTQTLVIETAGSFTAQPNANQVIDFGAFQRGASTPFLPLDGAYFRMSSTGMQGVINVNGTETSTAVFPLSGGTGTFLYTNNVVYKFLIQTNNVKTTFWINNVKYGEISNPVGAGTPSLSRALPWSIRHAIVGGTAGAATQFLLKSYRVMLRGPQYADRLGIVGNRVYGSYQGLSGQTMGSLANYANNTNPTAAVPTNTTAALGTGLGGQFWETFSLAVNTDGIISSFQVPVGSAAAQGRRLVIRGVGLTSYVQTVVVGGPLVRQYSLAFGHTAVSLATAESASFATATTKAPRRIALAAFTQVVTAAQAVSTMVSQPGGSFMDFGDAPIFVNPGEFVALVVKGVGTVGTSGTIGHMVTFVTNWE